MARKGPRVVVIGAGSIYFGRQILWHMAQSEPLREGTLAYVDIDRRNLDRMVGLGQRVVEALRSPLVLVGATDRREALEGADFVVLTFARRNAYYRGVDTRIALKHGVTMCSSDTIGPGGIFRALRSIPEVMAVCEDIRRLCPEAWVINYINPTAVVGIALMRHAPDLKTFALCDGNHEPHNTYRYLRDVGLLGKDETPTADQLAATDLRIAGVNHCTWLLKFTYEGRDMLPRLREAIAARAEEEKAQGGGSSHSKGRYNNAYALALFDLYGAYPTAVGHTKEYVPFWQGYGSPQGLNAGLPPITPFDWEERRRKTEGIWREIEEYVSGAKPIEEFLRTTRADHAGDIIEAMWAGWNKRFFINGPNQGAVTNLPDDAFLELKRDVSMKGFRALPVGEMPRGLLGLTQQVLDTHELTVEAAMTCDRRLLRRAMMSDPIVNNLADGDAILADLLEAQREALPEAWFA